VATTVEVLFIVLSLPHQMFDFARSYGHCPNLCGFQRASTRVQVKRTFSLPATYFSRAHRRSLPLPAPHRPF
jgi:hypothetical protein